MRGGVISCAWVDLLHVNETICPRARDEADAAASARFQGACSTIVCQPRVLATLVPSVIERRPRCGLFGGPLADSQKYFVGVR